MDFVRLPLLLAASSTGASIFVMMLDGFCATPLVAKVSDESEEVCPQVPRRRTPSYIRWHLDRFGYEHTVLYVGVAAS